MKTIAFLNQKGGVGKTSCCYHLAGALAESGRRVLLVDNDPQASLSGRAVPGEDLGRLDPFDTLAAIYAGDARPTAAFIRPVWPGVDLIPGSRVLYEANPADPWDQDVAQQLRLANALAEVCGYDLCLIDCPPNLLALSWAALLASDAFVVPLQPEDFGAMGAPEVLAFAEQARATNPRLRLAGLLLTMKVARGSLHKVLEDQLRQTYPGEVFEATVPRSLAYASAVTGRVPITKWDRTGNASVAIRAVAGELLDRVGLAADANAEAKRAAKAGKGVA